MTLKQINQANYSPHLYGIRALALTRLLFFFLLLFVMVDSTNSTPATPTITTSSTDSPIPLVALTSGQLPLKLTHLTTRHGVLNLILFSLAMIYRISLMELFPALIALQPISPHGCAKINYCSMQFVSLSLTQ